MTEYLSKRSRTSHNSDLMSSPRRERNALNSKEVEQQITLFALENATASHLYHLIRTKFKPNKNKNMK